MQAGDGGVLGRGHVPGWTKVEDHPVGYADLQGDIPAGHYGGGAVETWDRGTWQALDDAEAGLRGGNLRFVLSGQRLHGRFTLARLKRDPKKQEAWEAAQQGADALAVEQAVPFVLEAALGPPKASPSPKATPAKRGKPPAPGAVRGLVPEAQEPQLCSVAGRAPDGENWVSEIKFDGYRLLACVADGQIRLLTRNGHDWAPRMPSVAAAIARLPVRAAMLDGELVSLRANGVSSFPGLQSALKTGRDDTLVFYVFDLLHLDGWDLRGCPLLGRKSVLARLAAWGGMLRYSDHHAGDPHGLLAGACAMGLEGIICKQADAPYRGGRSDAWRKVKCDAREEFVVLGWTPPGGSRVGIGALHVGYYDPAGRLHYAGGVGSGFDDKELRAMRTRLAGLAAPPSAGLLVSGDPIDGSVTWVRPEIVVEVKYTGWSGAGRVRHAVYLGVREDKDATQVVRDVADPDAARDAFRPARGTGAVVTPRKGWHGAVPPLPRPGLAVAANASGPKPGSVIITARTPSKPTVEVGGVPISHPDRQLWPGVTKRDLAGYWLAIADTALPGIAKRPLSILRCPDGIQGKEQFFQKNGHGIMPPSVRDGTALKQPYIAVDDLTGLISLAQMSAIELHSWGAAEADPDRPDRLVFDLDPGDGVPWAEMVRAAHDTRKRLERLGLASYCRTTGGKGLHVVVPLSPGADWAAAKPFCKAFADLMAREEPQRFLAHLKIADRGGRILVDWLRNGLGATAVASFSPRARPGAGVATPVAWREVTPKLDPAAFTVKSVPVRLARLRTDPWDGFVTQGQSLPSSAPAPSKADTPPAEAAPAKPKSKAVIVTIKPRPRA